MHRLAPLTLLALTACTSAVPADSLEYTQAQRQTLGVLMRPDAEPLPPAPEPEAEEPEQVAGNETPHLELDLSWTEDGGPCAFEVQAHGLPAIHRDEGTVAYLDRTAPGAADVPQPAWLVEQSIETRATKQHELTVDIDEGYGAEDAKRCAKERRALQRRIQAANERLASYRSLPPLDVAYEPAPWMDDERADFRAIPAKVRPVKVGYSASKLVFRVPGIEVVHTQPQDWWLDDDFCKKTPNVGPVWADPATGTAVVQMDYSSGACLCDDGVYTEVVALPPEVFEQTKARPTTILAQYEGV